MTERDFCWASVWTWPVQIIFGILDWARLEWRMFGPCSRGLGKIRFYYVWPTGLNYRAGFQKVKLRMTIEGIKWGGKGEDGGEQMTPTLLTPFRHLVIRRVGLGSFHDHPQKWSIVTSSASRFSHRLHPLSSMTTPQASANSPPSSPTKTVWVHDSSFPSFFCLIIIKEFIYEYLTIFWGVFRLGLW